MTYKELYDDAMRMLEHNEINGGEFDKMIEPLNAEVGNAEPVRHGTWRNYKDEHTCSVCGEVVTGDWMYEDSAYEYCPWCGARMDAERKEE